MAKLELEVEQAVDFPPEDVTLQQPALLVVVEDEPVAAESEHYVPPEGSRKLRHNLR